MVPLQTSPRLSACTSVEAIGSATAMRSAGPSGIQSLPRLLSGGTVVTLVTLPSAKRMSTIEARLPET